MYGCAGEPSAESANAANENTTSSAVTAMPSLQVAAGRSRNRHVSESIRSQLLARAGRYAPLSSGDAAGSRSASRS